MKVKVKSLSHVRPFATPWTIAHQAPPFMGLSRQKYWSGLPFLSTGDLPNPGMEPRSPALRADALTSEPPGKPHCLIYWVSKFKYLFSFLDVVAGQSLSCIQLFVIPWTTEHQYSLPFTISWSLLKHMSIKSMMPSNHSFSVTPFSSWPQFFPASGSFPVGQLFASGDQSISVSASVLPVNIQG